MRLPRRCVCGLPKRYKISPFGPAASAVVVAWEMMMISLIELMLIIIIVWVSIVVSRHFAERIRIATVASLHHKVVDLVGSATSACDKCSLVLRFAGFPGEVSSKSAQVLAREVPFFCSCH